MNTDLYFDYNGSTPIHDLVLETYIAAVRDGYGNTAAAHPEGLRSRELLIRSREQIAASIKASPDQIWFVSGGTEANNWALIGAAEAMPEKRHLVVSTIEHKSVLNSIRYLERRGHRVTWLDPEPHGALDPDRVKAAIEADTLLVSMMLVNNETGVLQPARAVFEACRERGVFFHCDAVAGLGKMVVNLDTVPCDYLTFSSHKMYAPKGCGVLYAQADAPLAPLIHGCGSQPGKRGGTVNMPAAAAFAKAFAMLDDGDLTDHQSMEQLRDTLEALIKARIPGATRNGDGARLNNTLSIAFPGLRGTDLVQALGARGVSVSAGSAATNSPSHVLRAMGLSDERAGGSLRISMGHYTDEDQISRLVTHLEQAVAELGASVGV